MKGITIEDLVWCGFWLVMGFLFWRLWNTGSVG